MRQPAESNNASACGPRRGVRGRAIWRTGRRTGGHGARGGLCCWAVCLAAGCHEYGATLMEFDSVARFDQAVEEPADVDYQETALRWPWGIRAFEGSGIDAALVWLFGIEPSRVDVDNPSGFARERMALLVEGSVGDLQRTADSARRLLWVAAGDPQVLNQIIAIEGIATLLAAMQVDPMARPGLPADPVAAFRRAQEELEVVRVAAPERRAGKPLGAEPAAAYLAALHELTARPMARAADDRALILVLARAAATEVDEPLVEPTRQALATALANALTQGLRNKLLYASPDVRVAALLTLYRLSGPRALAYSLRALSADFGQTRYDSSTRVRMTWIRLCAQLRGPDIALSYAGGPTPIGFLYDTITADEEPSLRQAALEAMAFCLERPVSFDEGWAGEWWREYSLERGREKVAK